MKYQIKSERLWVRSPVTNIVIKTRIISKDRELSKEQLINELKKAVNLAVNKNGILKSKVTIDDEGKAYFIDTDKVNYTIEESNDKWIHIIKNQEKIPFDISKGEYIRFFILNENLNNDISLLLIGHHLTGDGISYAYLIGDILSALNNEEIENKPLQLLDIDNLSKNIKLNFIIKRLIDYSKKKWSKTGKKFNDNDYFNMTANYWRKHSTEVLTYSLSDGMYKSLIDISKKNKIKINTLITTLTIKAAKECGDKSKQDVGQAVSIRNNGYKGMGNYASGISIDYLYDDKIDFYNNAKKIEKLLYDKLNDPNKNYFLLSFMNQLPGFLIDAIYYSSVDGYDNKVSKSFSKMFNYAGNPKGISITNLTKIPIRSKYGNFEIDDFIVVPPLILNGDKIFGIATLNNKMEISLSIEDNNFKEEKTNYFNKVVNELEKLVNQ